MKPYYQDEAVTIYHAEARSVLANLAPGSLAGCITDPPYSSGGQFRSDRANHSAQSKYLDSDRAELPDFSGDNRDQRSFIGWASLWMSELLPLVVRGAPLLAFTDWRQLPSMTDAVQVGGWNWQGLWVWDKGKGRPQGNRPTQSFEYVVYGVAGQVRQDVAVYVPAILKGVVPPTQQREHVTEKPVEVVKRLIPLIHGGGRSSTRSWDPGRLCGRRRTSAGALSGSRSRSGTARSRPAE